MCNRQQNIATHRVELTNLFNVKCENNMKSDSFRCISLMELPQQQQKTYRQNHKLCSKRLTNEGSNSTLCTLYRTQQQQHRQRTTFRTHIRCTRNRGKTNHLSLECINIAEILNDVNRSRHLVNIRTTKPMQRFTD